VNDLVALTDAISPAEPTWCLGIMAGDATGWILTDWLEDLLLHQSGADAYRSFVAGDLPFTSAEVMAAAEAMDAMLSTEGAVLGGLADAANRSFFDVANPLADTPPGCWITHQASFQRAFFRLAGIDPIGSVDVMRTPGPTAADALMVASVSTVSLTSDNPEAAAFLEHLADPSAATLRFGSGYTFSPYEAFDLAGYPDDPLTLRMAEALAGSTVFPDASDLMADGLRSTFHRELVAWATGQQGIGDALEAVEAARTGG
jgi:alpha-glucoside transport system substrate-binding protein